MMKISQNRWDKFFDEHIKEIAKEAMVLDIGSGYAFQKKLSKYRCAFTFAGYYSLDYDVRYQPNLVGDIHNLPVKDNSVDAIICKAVLEHVPEPQRAVREMYRILRKNGKIIAYVPFLYGYHGGRSYKDYYRFTKDGVQYMFRQFAEIKIAPVRGYSGTLCLFVPMLKWLAPVANLFDRLAGSGVTSGYYIFAIK